MKGVPDIMMDSHCENIGVLFDCGINELGLSPETMTYYFIRSGAAELMSNWHPRLSAGMDCMEFLEWCLERNGLNPPNILESGGISTRPEYWVGYMMAEYQWIYEHSFMEILDKVPFVKIVESYHPLHEAPEEKFYEAMEHWMGKI